MLRKQTGLFTAVFILGLIAALPIRTCLILYYIDPKTGFYNGSSSLATVLNILLIIVTVILLIPMFIKGYKKIEAAPVRSGSIGVISALLTVLFCIDAVHDLYQLFGSSGSGGVFINAVCGFAAAFFFAFFSLASFHGGKPALPGAALLPVIWATLHLMIAFMHYTTVVNISEYLFDMLKMVFVMLFFYYHARFAGRVSNSNEIKGMLAFGLPAILFCLVSTLPRYIALAFHHNVTYNLSEDLLFVALSVYIAAILCSVFLRKPSGTTGTKEGTLAA